MFDETTRRQARIARAVALSCPWLHALGACSPDRMMGRNRRNQSNSGKPDKPAHAPMKPHMDQFAGNSKENDAAVQQTTRGASLTSGNIACLRPIFRLVSIIEVVDTS